MSDARLRAAHRAWLDTQQPDTYQAYVAARQRMGLEGSPAPVPVAAMALLAVWPRYKRGRKRGDYKPPKTYSEAAELVRTYYLAAGWLPKVYTRYQEEDVDSEDYDIWEGIFKALPRGFPAERDPDWQPIQFGALISPDFSTTLSSRGVSHFMFQEWSAPGGRSGFMWHAKPLVRRGPMDYVSSFSVLDARVEYSVDKKHLAQRLLEASLRAVEPYRPNPPRGDDDE